MVMKSVRLLCYMFLFAFLDLTVHNVLNLLTNRNIALIYSVTICEQKTGLYTVKESNKNYSNHSPLLTMLKLSPMWSFELLHFEATTNQTFLGTIPAI